MWKVCTLTDDDNRSVEISAVLEGTQGDDHWDYHQEGSKVIVLRLSETYQRIPLSPAMFALARKEAQAICDKENGNTKVSVDEVEVGVIGVNNFPAQMDCETWETVTVIADDLFAKGILPITLRTEIRTILRLGRNWGFGGELNDRASKAIEEFKKYRTQ